MKLRELGLVEEFAGEGGDCMSPQRGGGRRFGLESLDALDGVTLNYL